MLLQFLVAERIMIDQMAMWQFIVGNVWALYIKLDIKLEYENL